MIAGLYGITYLLSGVACVRCLLPRHSVLNRVWLGLSLGLLLHMWLPALCAFFLRFSMAAHWAALGLLALVVGVCFLLRDRRAPKAWDEAETRIFKQLLCVALPLTALSAYLQYTHCLRPDEWGRWNVGQSTYGDLPMHLSFITGLKDAAFPPEYPFYPGLRLSYPFLTDSLSTSFYLMGWSLQASVIVPGTLMMALCFMGVMLLAREMTLGAKTVVLATLLFFLNGGLGFLYDFDQAAGLEKDGSLTLLARLKDILEGFYTTPTNQPEPNNLRWSNVIADLMIPQRTLLGGWCMVIPCLYLLQTAFAPGKREEKGGARAETLLAVWGGALPLIHTHSFLALGLCSLGVMVYDLRHEEKKRTCLARYVRYGVIAVCLAAPQLICFTFRQTFMNLGTETNTQTFLALHFNWVNNVSDSGVKLRDFYLWFYVKNIGLPFILLVLALFERDARMRRVFAGALPIILAAELIRFQPNAYDNNKLLYLAWLLCCMPVADYAALLWRRLKGLRARPVIAAAFAVITFLSAGLTLWRETVSTYCAFDAHSVAAGEWARDETEEDAAFLTGTQHLNPICAIAGRTIVCGPDLWLYWHGVDTTKRQAELRAFYTEPEENADVLEKYGVDYIYVSSYERASYKVDTEALERLYEVAFQNEEATVYRVKGSE